MMIVLFPSISAVYSVVIAVVGSGDGESTEGRVLAGGVWKAGKRRERA